MIYRERWEVEVAVHVCIQEWTEKFTGFEVHMMTSYLLMTFLTHATPMEDIYIGSDGSIV